jgi:hypothetical protein
VPGKPDQCAQPVCRASVKVTKHHGLAGAIRRRQSPREQADVFRRRRHVGQMPIGIEDIECRPMDMLVQPQRNLLRHGKIMRGLQQMGRVLQPPAIARILDWKMVRQVPSAISRRIRNWVRLEFVNAGSVSGRRIS